MKKNCVPEKLQGPSFPSIRLSIRIFGGGSILAMSEKSAVLGEVALVFKIQLGIMSLKVYIIS